MTGDWVYFILCPAAGLIKIGLTSQILRRTNDYFTESPVRVKFLGAIPFDATVGNLERAWHDRFRAQLHHGEWFILSRELIDAIATDPGFTADPIEWQRQKDDALVIPRAPDTPELRQRKEAFVAHLLHRSTKARN